MMDKDELLKLVDEEEIRFVEMQFMDILGRVKSVSIPAEHLERSIENGVLFDGSSIMGYATIDESDLRAYPDLDTFLTFPWIEDEIKTGRLICDIYTSDGDRFEGDPRYILQRQMGKARENGYEFNVGPEYEFFLFKTDEDGKPTVKPDDEGGYFDLMPLDRADKVRKECNLYFKEMGFEVEASHHEVASGQHEIDLRYDDALTIADQIMTLKHAIKTVAKLNDLHATFMPKPLAGVNGTGMHIHQSLVDENKNYFYDEDDPDGLSDMTRHYIGGLLEHAEDMCAVQNSWVNSYKRLIPGYEAPVYVSWAHLNRSVLARIPAGRGMGTRIEIRNPDPAGNPYLQFATLLAAGLKGMEEKMEPPEKVEEDIFSMSDEERKKKGINKLPLNLGHALSLMEESEFMKEVLGEHTFHHFLHKKREEWNEYRKQVTRWEIDKYLPHL
ncbi:MAG: type I glutamate--ammonia ligase [Candidatus Thermoplasmatota archaeon]|nr:type I glutamate--ammonia ligase [Candidatus Thermoplasmatota archaeon]